VTHASTMTQQWADQTKKESFCWQLLGLWEFIPWQNWHQV